MQNEEAQLLTIINRLLASFPAGHSGQGDDAVDGYLIGLTGLPVECVTQASVRFLRGQVTGHNNSFAPSPAELASEASNIHSKAISEERRHSDAIAQIESRPQDMTEEEMAKRKAQVERLVPSLKMKYSRDKPTADQQREAASQLAKMAKTAKGPVTISDGLAANLEAHKAKNADPRNLPKETGKPA